jgi:hypothetical protein
MKMSEVEIVCDPPYLINMITGEVIDHCVEPNDISQDKELEHYSITPPVPYVPNKYRENMKRYNKWLKGKEKYLELLQRFDKKIKYIRRLGGQPQC